MAMLAEKRTIFINCRLCLTEILNRNVTLLDGIIKDMLEIILPELNFSICENPSICETCLETLKQSYSFKSSCLEVEDKVQEFVDPKKETVIDLKDVLKKSNNVKQVPENVLLCRTCLSIGESSSYTKLCSYEGDPLQNMLEKCLPEMGLNLTKDPNICPLCLEQLEEQFHFIMQCLDTEAKINFYSQRKCIFKGVDMHNVYLFSMSMEETDLEKQYGPADNLVNGHYENNRMSSTEIEENMASRSLEIKMENSPSEIVDLTDIFPCNIKSKIESLATLSPKKSTDHLEENLDFESLMRGSKETFKSSKEVTFQVSKGIDGEEIITSETSLISQNENDGDSDMSVTKEYDLLELKKVTTVQRLKRKSGEQKPKTESKIQYKDDDGDKSDEEREHKKRRITRKCKICNFKTKFTSRMKAHMTINHSVKVPSNDEERIQKTPPNEEKMFKCRSCDYKTNDQSEHHKHKLHHRKAREQHCPYCSMVFVRHDFLKKHIATHNPLKTSNTLLPENEASHPKKPTSVKPSFAMGKPCMRNFSFNGHVLKMFKCRLCPYQTRLKSNYEKHSLTHKKSTEIVTHKCKICSFETIQKENFLSHIQSHENEGGNKIMRCFLCSFQPATESELKQHVNQVHKSGTG